MSHLDSEPHFFMPQLAPSFKISMMNRNQQDERADSIIVPNGSLNMRKISQDIFDELLVVPKTKRSTLK